MQYVIPKLGWEKNKACLNTELVGVGSGRDLVGVMVLGGGMVGRRRGVVQRGRGVVGPVIHVHLLLDMICCNKLNPLKKKLKAR